MGGQGSGDALARWLSGEGLTALDGLTAGSLDVIGVVDRDLRLRYVNWTTPGLRREDAMRMSALDLIPPGYQELAREVFTRALRTGVGERFETLYRNELGVMIWMVRVGPIRHEGEVIGLITINTDVTEQRRADVDRDRFFSLSHDVLAVITREGLLKRVNPAFGEMLGYDVEELVGKPFIAFVHPDDVERTLAQFGKVGASGVVPSESFENRYRRRDGTYRVFSWRGTVDPLTGDGYAVARDITAQRETEAHLRHAQKMEAVGQLAGGIAHDFNNLMQAVLGNAELALSVASPEVQEHLNEIAAAGRRAAELTKQLLVFSRRQPLHPLLIDVNGLLQRLMKLLRRLLPENITIDVQSALDLWAVNADPTQLEQVVINLCVNARDAMESGGALHIATENAHVSARDCDHSPWAKPGRFVCLSVVDTGVGMTADVRERVFDPFFTTKGNQRGTGLGLATVYGIIQQHGGFIQVESEVGRGTTFRIYLPADERVAPLTASKPAPEPARLRGQETILVAEDEEWVRRPLLQLLERAGYRTLAAVNGMEALQLLNDHATVDLAVLDVVMPGLGGPQAWERMRHLRPELRVIFISGYADDRYRERLPQGVEVLEKPFRTDELLGLIRRKLDG